MSGGAPINDERTVSSAVLDLAKNEGIADLQLWEFGIRSRVIAELPEVAKVIKSVRDMLVPPYDTNEKHPEKLDVNEVLAFIRSQIKENLGDLAEKILANEELEQLLVRVADSIDIAYREDDYLNRRDGMNQTVGLFQDNFTAICIMEAVEQSTGS